MRKIELTQGKVAFVDDEDYDYLNQWKWYAQNTKCGFYAARGCVKNKNSGKIFMHRVIMATEKGMMCDHADHNTLNNQKSNLRNCTALQNQLNKSSHKNSTSKYKGVSWFNGKWIAQTRFNKTKIYIGRFENEIDAAMAYDKKVKEFNKEFVNLNFK